ncbi:unnamed protein product [Prunus armeniaca]
MSQFFTKIKVENPKSLYILVNIFKTLNSHAPWTCANDTREIGACSLYRAFAFFEDLQRGGGLDDGGGCRSCSGCEGGGGDGGEGGGDDGSEDCEGGRAGDGGGGSGSSGGGGKGRGGGVGWLNDIVLAQV